MVKLSIRKALMLSDKARKIWLKLLKAEANHRSKKIKKHEQRLIEIELEMKKYGD
jgi:hypothetical protein